MMNIYCVRFGNSFSLASFARTQADPPIALHLSHSASVMRMARAFISSPVGLMGFRPWPRSFMGRVIPRLLRRPRNGLTPIHRIVDGVSDVVGPCFHDATLKGFFGRLCGLYRQPNALSRFLANV